ncbi:MAG: TonB-dependent receptor [Sphingomonas sp.]|nr:TonB-dependent receptor [Sphingomonas sp.]
MRRTHARILGTASLFALALTSFPAAAYAQDTDEDPPAAEETQSQSEQTGSGGTIVITGSRIVRPNLDSTVPITSVSAEDVMSTGDVSLGDQLNELPSLRNTFSTGNSTRFIGTAGLSLLDLRGLGTERTLVLVNNRRHVTASPGGYSVDVNTIPIDLLERIDIITGGNSAIYGSDAVAGVVNFITRRDFDGIRVRAQSGISEEGDRATHFVSATGGHNFDSGRGNIAVSLEYAKTDPLYFVQRDNITGAYSGRCQFNLVQNTAGEPASGANGPDQEFLCGVRNNAISDGGTIGTFANGNALRFGSDGNLFIDVPDRFIGSFTGNVIGGDGSTLRNTGQLAAGVTRYTANLLANYEVTPAFRMFLEAKFVRVETIQEGQPSFWQGSVPAFFGGGSNIRCNNPFLTASSLATLQSFGICTNVAAGTFNMSRFNVDFGGRGELGQRDTYRFVGGFDGEFLDNWRYEISVNYGRLETELDSLNNLVLFDLAGNPDGFLLALDAVRNSAGQIVCRVNEITVTRPDCVPINVFGWGAPSQAALDFVNTTAFREQRATQLQLLGFVSGNSGRWFELPGGPIGFALGVEYRRETAFARWDDLTASGGTFLNAIQPFTPPAEEVLEAFGELRLPILRDLPFAHELTIEGAGRVSNYELGSTGTVWAYNIGGIWSPVSDIRFRANYSTSVRAPTLGDLYSPQSQNFAFIADPCDSQNIGNGPNRAANCAAAGVPATTNAALAAICASSPFPVAVGDPFVNCTARAFSTSFLQGGNDTLTEERSKSLTIGGVLQPRWIPGLAITVDYYDISIDNLISTLTAQTIINQCYDAPGGINNPFCAIVFRDPATGLFDSTVATIAGPVNFAAFDARGIDFDVSYRRTFSNGHRLSIRAIATRILELTAYLSPSDPTFGNRFRSEVGDASWQASLRVGYEMGPIEMNYQLRYIGRQTIGTYEQYFEFQGRPPTNADATAEIWYPDVFYHNIRLGYRINERFTFYGGVDNIGNRQPPLGLLGTAGGDPFDTIGRFFYAGVNINFR